MATTTPGVVAGIAGAYLVAAAITNQNPLDGIRKALTGGGQVAAITTPLPAGSSPVFGIGAGGQVSAAAAQQAAPYATGTSAPQLVTIGGGFKLAPPAANAYRAASMAFGAPLPITDAYRTPAQQAACHAAKPGVCAPEGSSLHERGLAIDLDTSRLPTPDAAQKANQALTINGWVQFSPAGEPWHYSYGVRG